MSLDSFSDAIKAISHGNRGLGCSLTWFNGKEREAEKSQPHYVNILRRHYSTNTPALPGSHFSDKRAKLPREKLTTASHSDRQHRSLTLATFIQYTHEISPAVLSPSMDPIEFSEPGMSGATLPPRPTDSVSAKGISSPGTPDTLFDPDLCLRSVAASPLITSTAKHCRTPDESEKASPPIVCFAMDIGEKEYGLLSLHRRKLVRELISLPLSRSLDILRVQRLNLSGYEVGIPT